jgi:hypothetical protein
MQRRHSRRCCVSARFQFDSQRGRQELTAMAYDEQLATRVRRYFAAQRLPTEEKRMMGGLCFMVRGKMCVGVESERLMARVGPEHESTALRRPGCTPMDFTGRPLKGYVFVARKGFSSDEDLKFWLDLALDFNPQAKSSKERASGRKPGRRKSAKSNG